MVKVLIRCAVLVYVVSLVGCSKGISVTSPDGSIQMHLNNEVGLSYSVTMDGQIVVADSRLALELGDGALLGAGLDIVSSTQSSGNESWHTVVGRKAKVTNHYNQLVVRLKEKSKPGREYSLVCRAYDDGIAFRYAFDQAFADTVSFKEEHTEFAFEDDYTCWPAYLNRYNTEHQALYPKETLSGISPEDIIGLPLTIQMGPERYCSITEAALTDWAGVYVTRQGNSELMVESGSFVGGGEPFAFETKIPDGIRKLRIVIDADGSNGFDHVDIADAKLILADGGVVWLSDLKPTAWRQEWGELKNDTSIDGNPIRIAGKEYKKGLGTHSSAVIAYQIPEGCTGIAGLVGIDSEVGDKGKAKFKLYAVTDSAGDQQILRSTLSRTSESSIAVETGTPAVSPWRVIMLGRTPADLVNSDIVLNLNEPSKIADTSWIESGVSSWNWLSCGGKMDMKLLKGFIDLSASMGWEYVLVDDGWYKGWNCTESIDALDMPALVAYAKERGVKVWVWVHWQALDQQLEEAMSLYQKWGIVGIKTDFMSRDDQWMVGWYHKVLASAASHQLMINFHGCYKPTGVRRTWPNLMTREAIYGEEQNLGSRQNDPVHKTTLPFTRMLAGPMDYTPGSMQNETRDSWSAGRPVKTLGTRCQELAICVLYDTPIVSMADRYDNYAGQKGVEFLKDLPTTWDDTKVLDGQIGEFITTARKCGDVWYLASITNWDERTVAVPLDFLGAGRYQVSLFEDGPDANQNARDIQTRTLFVTADQVLSVKMASGGGFVAIIRPVK